MSEDVCGRCGRGVEHTEFHRCPDLSPVTPDETVERELYEAQAAMRRAGQAFSDCSPECLARIITDVAAKDSGLLAVARAMHGAAQHALAEKFDDKTMEISGITWERSKPPPSRTGWNTKELLENLYDSVRRDDSGALVNETNEEKILRTWNLGAPRLSALDEYGIDRDVHCHTTWSEDRSWKCQPAVKKQLRRKKP